MNHFKAIATPISIGGISFTEETLSDKADAFVASLQKLFSSINTILTNTFYVPAIRGLDKPEYMLADYPSMDFIPGDNEGMVSTFAYSGKSIGEIISEWSEAITGSEIEATIVPGRQVRIESLATPKGIPVIGDGFGTNQLVQLLLTLAISPEQSLIAIEEPEIHSHPKAQLKLCSILVEIVKEENKQLLITTHSEHILNSFLQSVKNDSLSRDELSRYYFKEKGKEPNILKLDEVGDIYPSYRNFFASA